MYTSITIRILVKCFILICVLNLLQTRSLDCKLVRRWHKGCVEVKKEAKTVQTNLKTNIEQLEKCKFFFVGMFVCILFFCLFIFGLTIVPVDDY